MRMEKMSFGGVEVFEVRGWEGVFLELEMEDVRSEAESGLILASVDSVLTMENSSVDEIVVDGGCVLEFDSGAEVTVRNSSLTNVTRRSEDGGVFAGRVGEEKKVEVKNCTVMEGKCVGNPSNGGGVMVSVGRKGKFVFDLNRVEKCAVVGNKGYGGGVFVEFEDEEAGYSMKEDVFKENAAAKGMDVFVVSGAPDVMLREDLWMGSVDEESTPEENVWVVDSLTDTVIDLSVKKYLFPSEGMIVFIEAGRSTMADTCGSEVSPCDKFADGFGHMGDDKTTIQINNENSIESEINRKGISLAVRGRSGESLLEFVEWGCFVQDEGDGQTTLSLNRLRFKLPRVGGEGNSGALRVCVGMMMVMNCKFGAGGGEKEETGMRIVEEIGGEVRMEQVVVEGMIFSGEGGIGAVKGGVFHMNNTNISKIVGKGKSLIEGEEGIEFGMWRGNIVDVEVERGGVMEMKKAQRVEIEEGNVFNGCRSVFGDGGGMKWEVDEGGSFEFVNGEVEQCSVNGESGRGGGVFVYVDNRTSGMIRFEGIVFLQNSGAYGRDMFLDCRDLNETVTTERFGLRVTNEEGREIVDMQGVDRVRFVERHVDLCVFLVEWKWREVHVSEEGCDMVGCGNGSLPCKSLWRGVNNVDRDGNEGGRIKIKGRAKVGDWEDVSGIVVESGVEGEVCVVEVGMEVKGGDGKWVFENRKTAGFERVEFCLPAVLERGQEFVLYSESESGILGMQGCLFVLGDLDDVGYGVLKAKSGSVYMVSCTIENGRFSVCPFYICSCGVFEECRIVGMKRRDGEEGGGLKVTLADVQILMLNRTDGWECECSATSGRGGFLFVDSLASVAEQPFQLKDVSLKGNQAYRGKSVFVVGGDLNKSVTGDSFAFDFSGLMESENEFVGKEGREEGAEERDLLRYVVGYSSKKIHVCGSGEDVKRCGSEDDPCFSMWKGMEQLENTREMKEVVVMELGRVEDEWDLANVTWRGGGREDEEESKDMLMFCGKSEGVEEWFVRCEESFCVKNLKIVIGESVGEEKKEVVSGRGKAVEFEGCRVVSEVPENGRIPSFVVVRAGSLMMKKVTFERMKMRGSGIVAFEGVSCLLEKVKMEFETHFGGSGIAVEGGTNGAEEHEATSVVMNGTEFVMVEREDDGPSVMESVCTGGEREQQRGGMLLKLNEGGDILMKDGRIVECECSEAVGRGGGVYLWSELRGDLGFVFDGVKLSGNKAHVGRDVFIECVNISRQINESQFKMDLRAEVYIRGNGIYGIDEVEEEPVDLIELITVYQSSTIVVSNVFGKGGGNWRKCGTVEQPCLSVGYGLEHLVAGFNSMVAVDGESEIEKEIEIGDVVMRPKSWEKAKITIGESLVCTREGMIDVDGKVVVELVSFMFGEVFPTVHKVVFDVDQESISFSEVSFGSLEPEAYESAVPVLVKCTGGQVMMRNCEVEHVSVEWLMCFGGAVSVREMKIKSICCKYGGIIVRDCKGLFGDVEAENIRMDGGSFCEIENRDGGREMKVCHSKFLNVTSGCEKAAGIRCSNSRGATSLSNCTLEGCQSLAGKGNVIQVWMSEGVFVDGCKIDCGTADEGLKTNIIEREKICWWNGSAVDLTESKVKVEDTTIAGSSNGGITMRGGNVNIEKGEFMNNNPSIEGYPSLRRNIICSDSGTLNVMSLKGGDGWKDNTSLWILNEGCSFEGIASERDSSFFIPMLESVEAKEVGEELVLAFKGMLLVPCNLSFMVVKQIGEEKQIEKYGFGESRLISETAAEGRMPKERIREAEDEAEVRVSILFGDSNKPSTTDSFILKNKSETQVKGNGKIVEGGKEGKSFWPIIVVVLAIVLFIVLIASIVLVVRWRKQKRRTEELEEIVNDNIRKDPKAFEMVTMEMSPEAQWKRAEREAEKKNEERIKKRVYAKSLGHSESSEHLLSESGSTEYILGRDSDKIPDWALEKFDEEEDDILRKRTPSPSISSTSTTDTSDSDSTFVRGEDLCPTTSSMSNLVDAMACSSSHEKLIVDLRDSLFMLLHGRNEKKEMAIGTLEEREITAAQILFWVVNGALHSFEECEVPLQSLTNLSPHIVLFSEHMVICVAMHSDCSSSDSDSSSISSSTVVTSASDDDSDSLPSSAFEDEDDFKKECLRWKAPELLMNRKMGASKKSVVFSIGMMLWECLTLKVPFGEYEAETAGQKIVNGERPPLEKLPAEFQRYVEACWSGERKSRPTLVEVKRALFGRFPKDGAMFTVSDAITYLVPSRNDGQSSMENDSKETVATINEVQNIDMK